MKKLTLLIIACLGLLTQPRLPAQCVQFTEEHLDLLGVIWDGAARQLSLMASDDTHGMLYTSNQCVVVCPESMKYTLSAGMPFGNEGDPLWILPQNSYAGVPYVGVSAETIPAGVFQDPFTIRLTRLEGPGQFMLWQAGTFGAFDIKMDTRDGIGPADKITPLVGAHEHYNWGFTTSGVYRLYFQVSGTRVGETTNIVSAETPFTFQILPLSAYENWVATNWPCDCDTNTIGAGADPDHDGAANVWEYASGTDAKDPAAHPATHLSLITTNGFTYGAVTYTLAKTAVGAAIKVQAADSLTATQWTTLTNLHLSLDQGATQLITVRDSVPTISTTDRFFHLQVRLP